MFALFCSLHDGLLPLLSFPLLLLLPLLLRRVLTVVAKSASMRFTATYRTGGWSSKSAGKNICSFFFYSCRFTGWEEGGGFIMYYSVFISLKSPEMRNCCVIK